MKKLNIFNLLNFPRVNKDNLENYRIGGFHPSYIGEIYEERYVALRKISINRSSTFWICKDLKYEIFVILKIFKSSPIYTDIAYDEIEILQKIDDYQNSKMWKEYLKYNNIKETDTFCVKYLNFFILNGPLGNHVCIVLEFLGFNLLDLVNNINLNEKQITNISNQLMQSLLFLNKINVIHTNIHFKNIMVKLNYDQIEILFNEDEKIISQYYEEKLIFWKNMLKEESNQINELMTKKQKKQLKKRLKKKEKNKLKNKDKNNIEENNLEINLNKENKNILLLNKEKLENKIILKNYKSFYGNLIDKDKKKSKSVSNFVSETNKKKNKNNSKIKKSFKKINYLNKINLNNIKIKLIGFSNSINSNISKYKLIQNISYRSPEIFLKLSFNNRVDIWSLGCLIYKLIFKKDIFQIIDNIDVNPNLYILQLMENKLGKIPKNLIVCSSLKNVYFEDSNLKNKKYFYESKVNFYKLIEKKKFSKEFINRFSNIWNNCLKYESFERSSPLELLLNFENINQENSISFNETEENILHYYKNIQDYKYCNKNIINLKLYSYHQFFKCYKEFN